MDKYSVGGAGNIEIPLSHVGCGLADSVVYLSLPLVSFCSVIYTNRHIRQGVVVVPLRRLRAVCESIARFDIEACS